MSWFAWLGIAYAAVALLALRPLAGHFAWNDPDVQSRGRTEGFDWFWGTCIALGVLLFWPGVLVVLLLLRGLRKLPKIGAEREAELKAREERLREAEKELGLC